MDIAIGPMGANELGDIARIDTSQEQTAEYVLKRSKRTLGLTLSKRALETPTISTTWGAREVTGRMELWRRNLADGATFYGAHLAEKLVGFVLVSWRLSDGTVELYSIFVDRAHRRQGIGSALVAKAEERAAELRAHTVHMSTTMANAAAVDFYRARGYRLIGVYDTTKVKDKGAEISLAKELAS